MLVGDISGFGKYRLGILTSSVLGAIAGANFSVSTSIDGVAFTSGMEFSTFGVFVGSGWGVTSTGVAGSDFGAFNTSGAGVDWGTSGLASVLAGFQKRLKKLPILGFLVSCFSSVSGADVSNPVSTASVTGFGLADGDGIGVTDGDDFGVTDGDAFGLIDGDAFGLIDGDAFGLIDGDGVAIDVTTFFSCFGFLLFFCLWC